MVDGNKGWWDCRFSKVYKLGCCSSCCGLFGLSIGCPAICPIIHHPTFWGSCGIFSRNLPYSNFLYKVIESFEYHHSARPTFVLWFRYVSRESHSCMSALMTKQVVRPWNLQWFLKRFHKSVSILRVVLWVYLYADRMLIYSPRLFGDRFGLC